MMIQGAQAFVAIDNMACFPAMMRLGDGQLGAFVYNSPSHVRGVRSGIELWTSDDGAIWQRRADVSIGEADNEGHANISIGRSRQGTLIVVAGRYRLEPGGKYLHRWRRAVICHSTDEGHTWQNAAELDPPRENHTATAFGTMVTEADGTIVMAVYMSIAADHGDPLAANSSVVVRSTDGGATFGDMSVIEDANHNETALLVLDDGALLAAARTLNCDYPDGHLGITQYLRGRLDLFASTDRGRTWRQSARLTLPGQHPAHLLQLKDGRIWLTYGCRITGSYGVQARVSEDNGKNWSNPIILIDDLASPDCGYPATVQLDDGRLVTVYYSARSPWHQRYHMGVLRYEPPGG